MVELVVVRDRCGNSRWRFFGRWGLRRGDLAESWESLLSNEETQTRVIAGKQPLNALLSDPAGDCRLREQAGRYRPLAS